MKTDKILVTKTYLPPFKEYSKLLEKIWESRWVTNNGVLAQELESKLEEYLGVKHVIFVANGTIAMQIALQSLDIKKSVITTPFTFAATTTSIIWEKCNPVFVDINPNDYCIDVSKIESAITKDTEAILAVHVFGYPCNVKAIEKIARKYNLKVIYDAAHAFDVKIDGKSILNFGDISTVSLHATKLFHTVEGGLIVTNNDALANKVERLKDFGLDGDTITDPGINGKNSEFHAAMGIANFKYISEIKKSRKRLVEEYQKTLKLTGIHKIQNKKDVTYNYSYFPVVFNSEELLLKVKKELELINIFPRRYFYPSLNTLSFVPYYSCPISESISKRILCLPLYHDLSLKTVKTISTIISKSLITAKPTLTVGIPAYNEEKNIVKLINSVLNQKNINFTLKEIIVDSDGSTDDTVKIIKKNFSDSRIKIINNSSRTGKVNRLNEIYSLNNSDYILTLDGDISIKDNLVFDEMVKIMVNDNDSCVVAGNLMQISPDTYFRKLMYVNGLLWSNIRHRIKDGNHISNLYGAATLLKKEFSKSFQYPNNITADEEFLFVKAYQKNGFRYARNAVFYFNSPANITDFIRQGRRFLKERDSLIDIFGQEIHLLHQIPLRYKVEETIKIIIKNPFYAPASLFLLAILRIIPYKDSLNNAGVWEIAVSTKEQVKY